jgi:hypothetical protein
MEKIMELVKNNNTEISKDLCIVFLANDIVTSPITLSISRNPSMLNPAHLASGFLDL